MPDIRNAVVYIMGGSYPVFTKYPTGMPTTESNAKALVANWKAINPAKRFAKYVIMDDVVDDATKRAQELLKQGKDEQTAIDQGTAETLNKITTDKPKPSILLWVLGGIGTVAVIGGVVYIVTRKS